MSEQGWTGKKCPRCNGCGQDNESSACAACAGTGDEYGPLPRLPLLPCPFCGGGQTEIQESLMPPAMSGKGSLISATVHHWCEKRIGVVASRVSFTGREVADAIAAWNRRAGLTT